MDDSVSIAVMPFRNLSPEPDLEFFATGFVEDLIADLTRFTSLRVLASQSTFGLNRTDRSVDDVASEWHLQYVLGGSVRRGESEIRVSVQLVRVADHATVWAERFDAPLHAVFAIQDEITATVAGKLAVRIDDARLQRTRGRSPDELPVYDCWLRGMDCLKHGTLEGDEEARQFFEQALAIDSSYAPAYTGLSLSHYNEWTCDTFHLWDESESNAFDYAVKAATLDDTDAMVHAVLARVTRHRHEHERADHHATRALALNPNDANVLIQVAISQGFGGEAREGYELATRAIRLNPLHSDWYFGIVGLNLCGLGKIDEAESYLAKAGDAIVNFGAYRAACAAMLGDMQRARHEYERFETLYRRKIAFGREPSPGEAVRWVVQVEPFRHIEHSHLMPDALRQAGLVEIDVEAALNSRPSKMVRPAGIPRPPGNSFIKEGEVWSMAYEGAGAQLVEVKGFHDLARLLAQPNEPVHCLDLLGAVPTSGSPDEMLDSQARRDYRRRIEELQSELERAETNNDFATVDRARAELDAVVDELAKATGLGGRSRKIGDPAEKARSTVRWRIRAAIKKILAAHLRLGQHLSNSIRTGMFCVYSPESAIDWEL